MSDDGEEEAEEELGPNLGVSCALGVGVYTT